MRKQIKPVIHEISLAFNPANRRSFFMKKDQEDKMDWIIELLKTAEPLIKEEQIDAILKDVPERTVEGIKSALRILHAVEKEGVPQALFSVIAKALPDEYGSFAASEKSAEEIKKEEDDLRDRLTKEITEKLSKDDPAIKDVVARLEATESLLKEATEKARLVEITNELMAKEIPGDVAKSARIAFSLEQIDPKLFKEYIESLEQGAEILKTLGFEELGGAGEGAGSMDAYAKLREKVDEKVEKDDSLSPAAAWKKVIKENSRLYREYTDGRRSK